MIFKTKRKTLKCFYKESRARGYRNWIDCGIQTIGINKIVGSVGRCLDFGPDFSVMDKRNERFIKSRISSIEEALEEGKFLPPVKLYKMDDEYYIFDGHHRIAAAKKKGQKFVDAYVSEYFPLDDTAKKRFIQKKIDFENKTKLQGIDLSRKENYDKLLLQIEEHKSFLEEQSERKISFNQAARDWNYSIYFPVIDRIKTLNLKEYFPKATMSDIYVFLCEQIRLRNRKAGRYNVKLEETLEELGIVAKSSKIIFSEKGLKEKILKIFRPCFYLGKCKYEKE